jgi:hypothetical protein
MRRGAQEVDALRCQQKVPSFVEQTTSLKELPMSSAEIAAPEQAGSAWELGNGNLLVIDDQGITLAVDGTVWELQPKSPQHLQALKEIATCCELTRGGGLEFPIALIARISKSSIL